MPGIKGWWKNQIKNFSDSHLNGTKTARRYPQHPLWGSPQQSFRTDKARLPQSVEASLLFRNTSSLNRKSIVVSIDFAIFVPPTESCWFIMLRSALVRSCRCAFLLTDFRLVVWNISFETSYILARNVKCNKQQLFRPHYNLFHHIDEARLQTLMQL